MYISKYTIEYNDGTAEPKPIDFHDITVTPFGNVITENCVEEFWGQRTCEPHKIGTIDHLVVDFKSAYLIDDDGFKHPIINGELYAHCKELLASELMSDDMMTMKIYDELLEHGNGGGV